MDCYHVVTDGVEAPHQEMTPDEANALIAEGKELRVCRACHADAPPTLEVFQQKMRERALTMRRGPDPEI